MKKYCLLFLLSLIASTFCTQAVADVVWYNGTRAVSYSLAGDVSPVVTIALDMFSNDMKAVTGQRAVKKSNGSIEVIQLNKLSDKQFKNYSKMGLPISEIIAKKDAFYIGSFQQHIIVMGSNARGTAYGVLQLSAYAGVSPWIWWGDVKPARRRYLAFKDSFHTLQAPSVEYRGIFINDEDWSTRPWAHNTLEPQKPLGYMGPGYYRKLFKLMLRLRANTLWPAMHPGTTPFFKAAGNKQLADSFAIILGSSHCEPMLRNNVGEWDSKQLGDFNFATNHHNIESYWAKRIDETAQSEAIYTLGIRGIHDGSMEGVKGLNAQTKLLQHVINTQRHLLTRHLKHHQGTIPQLFVPYKEVLDIYNNGLKVPEDVTLMWCDDNYGYLTQLPNAAEQRRKGGSGIYYHLSYWGRPHDYLWLCTTQPGLIYHELSNAYEHGARKIWMINVHDPKVAAYQLSLAMDMAWNINSVNDSTINQHLQQWLSQQFGDVVGTRLLPVMQSYYKLTAERKPEFMGWSQVEAYSKQYPKGITPVTNTEFNADAFGNEADHYLLSWKTLCKRVKDIASMVPSELKDAYFAAVEYPIEAAACMVEKQVLAQESRQIARPVSFHHDAEALIPAAHSIGAYNQIVNLTNKYNQLAGGKWNGLMDMQPRKLPVFGKPTLTDTLSDAEIEKYGNLPMPLDSTIDLGNTVAHNAANSSKSDVTLASTHRLGHSMNALNLPATADVSWSFDTAINGQANLILAFIPTQPINSKQLRVAVWLDDKSLGEMHLEQRGRTEQWKQNVLRGQVIEKAEVNLTPGSHTLKVKALDANVVLDQWMVTDDTDTSFYLIPVIE